MKKLSIIACGILLISLSSCTTNCTCTTSATGTYASMYTSTTTVIEDVKGSCEDANTSTTSAGTTYTSTCK